MPDIVNRDRGLIAWELLPERTLGNKFRNEIADVAFRAFGEGRVIVPLQLNRHAIRMIRACDRLDRRIACRAYEDVEQVTYDCGVAEPRLIRVDDVKDLPHHVLEGHVIMRRGIIAGRKVVNGQGAWDIKPWRR